MKDKALDGWSPSPGMLFLFLHTRLLRVCDCFFNGMFIETLDLMWCGIDIDTALNIGISQMHSFS